MTIDVNDKRKTMSLLTAGGATLAIALAGGYLVAPNEGAVNKTYIDPVGIITSCLGHTQAGLKLGVTFTDAQCLNQFAKDLNKADDSVRSTIKTPMTIYEEAALISFTYNVGGTKFASSTLAKDFNAGNKIAACNELIKWVYSNKKKLKGLENRREQERQMCLGQMEWSNVGNN